MDEWYSGIYNHIQMIDVKCLARLAALEKAIEAGSDKSDELVRLREVQRANDRTLEKFQYWFEDEDKQLPLPF